MSDDMSAAAGCCRCCTSFILTSGLTVLFIWLSLRTSSPKCYVLDFYVPALNTTNPTTSAAAASAGSYTPANTTIALTLRLENVMKDKGILYDDVHVTIFYGNSSIANYTVPSFRQGHHKKATKPEVVQTRGVPWREAYVAATMNGSMFRVGLETRMRYRIMFFHTKRHGLVVKADVNVDYSGQKNAKKKIRLKSGGLLLRGPHHACMALSILFYLLILS